jgi:hypothetical protein
MLELNRLYLMDCMELMKEFPDKYFELAIVDPPYGDASGTTEFDPRGRMPLRRTRLKHSFDTISGSNGKQKNYAEIKKGVARTGGTWAEKYENRITHWDVAPPPEYFKELARVSQNQIIWGGNYFALPPTRCFLVWKKLTISENFSMAMCEYAWTSFNAMQSYLSVLRKGTQTIRAFT